MPKSSRPSGRKKSKVLRFSPRKKNPLKILVTAGATREYLDPVRFFSNPSTGEMGFALAAAARRRGHRVVLVSGPTGLKPPAGVKMVPVTAAREMERAVIRHFPSSDCLLMAAAVSDWRPERRAIRKIKGKERLVVRMVRNPDILLSVGRRKRPGQVVVGFALETENLVANARRKLRKKKLDLIVANRAGGRSSPFGPGRTSVVIIGREGKAKKLAGMTKAGVARKLLGEVEALFRKL